MDPQSAKELDELIVDLRESMGFTVVVVTHDLDALMRMTDRVAFLGQKKVLAVLPIAELAQQTIPEIKAFFQGFEHLLLKKDASRDESSSS